METVDWIMVAAWVLGTSAFGASFQRYVRTTRDYLLAGKRLRWWQIAVAQSADAVDATDFVATTGQGFRFGLSQIGFAWWGMGIGSILLSRYIAPLLYRTGVYTNAEYLELRYTASLRIASAVLQVLYRFIAMALVVYAMATMFKIVIGVGLWNGIWAAMALTLLYVFASGQLGVVMAAIPQVLLMVLTSVVIFVCAAVEVGGWQGFSDHAADLGGMLHLAGHSEEGVPAGVYLWGLILTLVTYPIVNQTVAQRIVAARSELDARKGTMASLLPWCIITGVSTTVGILGVVILPGLPTGDADFLFPMYLQRYLSPGWLGLGVAAIMLASMSTGAGIGTAIAGLMTVDVFKRLHRPGRSDQHDLRMTRLFAALAIFCGTFFATLIPSFGGMIPFYVALTGTFILPLVVPYVGGALYRHASRRSGMAALLSGVGLGCVLFLGSESLPEMLGRPQWRPWGFLGFLGIEFLPPVLGHPQWRPFWVLGFSSLVFIAWSMVENRLKGRIPETDLASILNAFDLGKPATPDEVKHTLQSHPVVPGDGQEELDYNALGIPRGTRWYSHPTLWEASAVVVLTVLMWWWW